MKKKFLFLCYKLIEINIIFLIDEVIFKRIDIIYL